VIADLPAWVFTVANVSISVVFAVILLNLYSKQSKDILAMTREWTGRLGELVEKSTAALTGVGAAIVTLQTLVASLCEEVREQQRRRN